MGSVEGRRCGNGRLCYHVRKLGLSEPVRLRAGHTGDVCDKCSEENAEGVEMPSEHAELFRTARVLFDVGVTDENTIIPTLVFAANVGEMPRLRDMKAGFAKYSERSGSWEDLYAQVHSGFAGLVVRSDTVNGVPILRYSDSMGDTPILRQVPFQILGSKDGQGNINEVTIDVFARSVKPAEVAQHYEWYLKEMKVEYDDRRGELAYKVYDKVLRLFARPETRAKDAADARYMAVSAGPSRLPPPRVVAGVYRTLRGSRTEGEFEGFRDVLAGRERGPAARADTLIPACVAWYVGGRGTLIEQSEEKRKVIRILNKALLGPCGKDPLPEGGNASSPLWRDTWRVSNAIRRLEVAIQERGSA